MPDDNLSLTAKREAAVTALADVPREPGAKKPDPILVADDVKRHFGGLLAVDVDHVEVQRGSITALIGPNGAGKTTFFNLLTGFDRPNSGSWTFNGRSLHGTPPFKVARAGMVRTFQLTKALSKLTVIENMRLGATQQKGESFWRAMLPFTWRSQEDAITQRAEELLARFKLDTKRDDFAGSLSGGQRKLLEMARALMVEPELVMLDEPMAGVNPALTQSLLEHVSNLREQGMTVLFVEHDMDMVRDIADWVVVMGQGKILAEGPPETVMSDPRVVDAYLGAHHDQSLAELEEQLETGTLAEEVAAELGQEPAETVAVERTGETKDGR
ncbi:ABC transporter ATP-binding protein [Jiangella rhizosphaerae]|uniref:ABC transporter ATP-binding protein n=1 Tax=Jiangella rhizosphaerae TaxID=2293569 RepID=A0A418KP18_9ACTN|nr:ABC transporter ATP-binding protein [Jiangella rhizosphaerae]RIQ20991.1 ABC transporter ATP-binding protein [Jiangella rhizosphaerae]